MSLCRLFLLNQSKISYNIGKGGDIDSNFSKMQYYEF